MQSQLPDRAHRKVTVYSPLPGAIPWFEAAETLPVKQEASSPTSELSSHPPSSDLATLVVPCPENIEAEDDPLSATSASDSSYVELPVLIDQPYPVKVEIDDPLAFHSPSNSTSTDVKLPQFPVKLEVFDPLQQHSVSCHQSTSTPLEPGPSAEHCQTIETEASYHIQNKPCKFSIRSCFVNLGPRCGPHQVKTEPCDSLPPLESPCPDNAESRVTAGQVRPDLFDLLDLPASNISVHNLCNLPTSSNSCLETEANCTPDVSLASDPLFDVLPTPPNPCSNTKTLSQTQTRTSILYHALCGFNHENLYQLQGSQGLRDPLQLEDSKFNIQPCFVNLGARIETRRVNAEGVTSAGGSQCGGAAVEPQIFNVPLANTPPWFTVFPEPRLLTMRPVELGPDEDPLTLAEGRSTSESPRTIGDGDTGLTRTVNVADGLTCSSDSDLNEDGTKSPRHNHQPEDSTPDTEVVRKSPARKINQGNKRNASKKGAGPPRQLKDNTRIGGQGSTGVLHCNICSRSFKDLRRHMLTHTDNRPFRCPSPCGKTFRKLNLLQAHSYTHMARKPFVCDICELDFAQKSSLVEHNMRHHTDVKPFNCAECGRGFIRKSIIIHHILCHSKDRRAFKDSGAPSNHSEPHLAKKLFMCSFCNKSFNVEKSLTNHELLHTDAKRKTFTCLECGKSFLRKISLEIHSFTHSSVTPIEACKLCDKTFSHKVQLYAHVRYAHSTLRPFKCSICPKAYKKPFLLKAHLYTHTGEKHFRCAVCDKGFVGKGVLKTHMLLHGGSSVSCPHPNCGKTFKSEPGFRKHTMSHVERSLICDRCGRGFKTKFSLELHMMIHIPNEERAFKCHCGKGFNAASNLKKHSFTHGDKKPFVCKVCGRGFCLNHRLKDHMFYHESHSFECKDCKRVYKSPLALRQHSKTHDPNTLVVCKICDKKIPRACVNYHNLHAHNMEKAFECPTCAKKWCTLFELNKHLKVHSKYRKFVCVICSKGCRYKSDLRAHMKIHSKQKEKKCIVSTV